MEPTVIAVEPSLNYLHSLRRDDRICHDITTGVYALPAYKDTGEIIRYKYCIVQHLDEEVYDCSCKEEGCLHVKGAEMIYPRFDYQNEDTQVFKDETKVCQLHYDQKDNRLIVGVFSDEADSFGIIKQTQSQIICMSCSQKPQSCVHRKAYIKENPEANRDIQHPREFPVKSHESIPYPLVAESDIKTWNGYFLGKSYPDHLFPQYDKDKKCDCGNKFNGDDPKASKWIIYDDSVIHTGPVDILVTTYYRPTVGNCKCIQEYDGRDHLLINLNNKHLFTYVWLLSILHSTQATRYPLYSGFVSANYSRVYGHNLPMPRHQYEYLRIAYNGFIRLLDLDLKVAFACSECRDNVDIIVIDATAVGFNTNLMPAAPAYEYPDLVIPEYEGGDKIFVANHTARGLIAIYVGLVRGVYVKKSS